MKIDLVVINNIAKANLKRDFAIKGDPSKQKSVRDVMEQDWENRADVEQLSSRAPG